MRPLLLLPLLAACASSPTVEVGDFAVTLDRSEGTLEIAHLVTGEGLHEVRLHAGTGSADIEMRFGSFLFTDVRQELSASTGFGPVRAKRAPLVVEVQGADGADLGLLQITPLGPDGLALDLSASDDQANRTGLSAACDPDDHFLGLGGHAMDVDHVGEAFGLWVSEPGIGKVDSDEPPSDWALRGTRHDTSFPVPFLLRPHRGQGLLVDSAGRVEVDLCATDPERFEVVAWQGGTVRFALFTGRDAVEPIQRLTAYTGRPELPPPWVFAPWNDAVRGPERVRAVADLLRSSGAPSSVIWTEDWKGGEESGVGYHLKGEWSVDETLYPDAPGLADELQAAGFKWFAYFSPFVREGTDAWDEALADDVVIHDDSGAPYRFDGVTFEDESLVDLSTEAGRSWAQERMRAALDLGFDGWMTDYAEWLPHDAVLASGDDALLAHNIYPEWWQLTNAELLGSGNDTSFFVRSGWIRSGGMVPVVWGGDQRTSFDGDDGLPTVLALGLGLSASGVPIFTHDVAGYQSVGNPPSDKELWFRWAALGAFTPILRTHHGAFEQDNWQLDSDAETTEYWAAMATEHMRLWPYRYGLAARATDQGIPMILPVALRFDGGDWGRTDAWMLGDSLLVAPVLEAGVTGREVDLPDEVTWYDWWTHEPVTSGWTEAPVGDLPVFAASGTTVPVFSVVPDTLTGATDPDITTLDDADGGRIVYLFGGGGGFVEADGTRYRPEGSPTGPGEATARLASGTVEVAGVTLTIEGEVERDYTVVVVD